MKKSAFKSLLAALSLIGISTTAHAVEGYIMEIGVAYEVHPQDVADARALGMRERGEIGAVLEFVKPECLVESRVKNEVTYYASGGTVDMLGTVHHLSMEESAYINIYDLATDRFDLHLRVSGYAGAPYAPLRSLIIANSSLPDDAIQSTDFPTNSNVIEDYWLYPGTQAYFTTTDPAIPSVNFAITGLNVDIRRVVPNLPTPPCK